SSSRKLAGVFYGYDFTVLRVFFTAGVTAMSGVIILGYVGALDLDLIYINPMYLWSAIVGGLIMGVGFIVGGFCPGTSICAMAIGKIDAFVFVLGGILGVYIFAEGYSFFEPLYMGSFWGNVRIFDTFGITQGAFACGLIVVAVGAFYATDYIERRVNGTKDQRDPVLLRKYYFATGIALVLAVAVIFMPDMKTRMMNEVDANGYLASQSIAAIVTDELAFRLLDHDRSLLLVDVRHPERFKEIALPGALNIQIEQLFSKDTRDILSESRRHYVFIGENEAEGKRAAILARNLGYENIMILKGGMKEFSATLLTPEKAGVASTKLEKDAVRFRTGAGPAIAQMIKEGRSVQKSVRQTKKISGGC
ncbi:MAG: YeeE/YedE thiosulfate transporter family protein, partial [Ignavibacteriales bacterium]|nr:YeeE/YedE thiosulfate transporter family protein [Ignavibacteriales bacterium]